MAAPSRRFAILFHQTTLGYPRPDHWDFMLEDGDSLQTWALPEEPAHGQKQAAEKLADHRLAYLDYEGEVSGNRGSVRQWDSGIYLGTPNISEFRIELTGQRFSANVSLREVDAAKQIWEISFEEKS